MRSIYKFGYYMRVAIKAYNGVGNYLITEGEKRKLEEERTFNLKETTREKLLKERMSDASTIVVKRGKTLLSAKIPKRLSLSDKEFSQSLCNNCKNCRPILCKKVLDRIYSWKFKIRKFKRIKINWKISFYNKRIWNFQSVGDF